MKLRYVLANLLTLALPMLAHAGAVITYHGRILDSNDRPLEASNVTFKIRIYSPNPGKCLLYEETRDLSMTNTNGVFVIPIGDGVGTRSASDPGIAMEEVFSNNATNSFNRTTYPKFTCNSGGHTFVPQTLDQRQLVVTFNDHSSAGEQALPVTDIGFVPLAVNSYDAQNIGGTPADSVLRVTGGSASAMSPANFSELVKIINGTTTQYAKSGQLNGANLPTLSSNQVLGWNGIGWSAVTPLTSESDPSVKSFAKANLPACGANQYLKNDGSGNLVCATVSITGGTGTVTSLAAGTGLKTDKAANAAIEDSGTLSVDVGTGANQVVQMGSDSKLPAVDGSKLTNVAALTATTASALSSTATINTSGSITSPQVQTRNLYIVNSTPNKVTVTAPAAFSDYNWILPDAQGTSGQVLGMSSTAGQLEWKNLSASGVMSVTADAPLSVDATTASSPKVSLPKADATHSGYLHKDDWAAFNAKQATGDYITALTGDVTSGTFTAGSMTTTVDKIKGVPVSATPTLSGQVLRYDSGSFTPGFVSMLDLRSKVTGALALSTACGANKTLTFDSLTDSLKCESISITKSQVSDLGTIGSLAAKNSIDLSSTDATGTLPVAKGGTGTATGSITGTGALSFAAGGSNQNVQLTPSGTGFTLLNGFVGIGTATPATNLDVNGAVKIGTTALACSATIDGTLRYNSTTNNYEICNGTASVWMVLEPQMPWTTAAADITAVRGGRYLVDTVSNEVAITLPPAPSHGDRVSFVDSKSNFGTQKLVVKRGTISQKIMGLSENMDVSTSNLSFEMVYDSGSNDWRIK